MRLTNIFSVYVGLLHLGLGLTLSNPAWSISDISDINDELNDPYTKEMVEKVQKGYNRDIKDKIKLTFKLSGMIAGQRAQEAFNHTLIKDPKDRQIDFKTQEEIPRVDVWQYQYINPQTGELITDNKPISSRKEFWKNDKEARIIAMTLYGSIPKYLEGLMDFIQSIKRIKKVNKIPDNVKFGYETFTMRVYVAKRNPMNASKGELARSTSDEFITKLLNEGCEIAYVDNHQAKVGRDATFWRFLVADEQMPEGQNIRYLSRDVDHKVTAAEMFTVGEWINSGLPYHRMHLNTAFIGPLTASIFGGVHEGNNGIKDMKRKIEHFPYRNSYGDDEIFTKYIIWDHMKRNGGVLTHKFRRGVANKFSNAYNGSSEDDPTSKYCKKVNSSSPSKNKKKCIDLEMPKGMEFPMLHLAHDIPLDQIKDKYFDLGPLYFSDKGGKLRMEKAKAALFEVAPQSNYIPPKNTCRTPQKEANILKLYRQLVKVQNLADQNK